MAKMGSGKSGASKPYDPKSGNSATAAKPSGGKPVAGQTPANTRTGKNKNSR